MADPKGHAEELSSALKRWGVMVQLLEHPNLPKLKAFIRKAYDVAQDEELDLLYALLDQDCQGLSGSYLNLRILDRPVEEIVAEQLGDSGGGEE